jgi:hypothetical protein
MRGKRACGFDAQSGRCAGYQDASAGEVDAFEYFLGR